MDTAPPESGLRCGGGAEKSGRPRAGIWHRDFTLLVGGSAFSQLGTLGAAAANPLLALALTDSPIVAGWVAAASTLPGLILHLPAGLIADRCDRWRIMLRSQLIRVLNSIILIVNLCVFAAPWQFLVGAALIDGSCAVFFRIAELAAVRHVVPDGEAENAMGTSEARHHVALVLGRPVGGLLFAVAPAFPYALDAVTSLTSVIALLSLKDKRLQPFEPKSMASLRGPIKRIAPRLKEGFRRISVDGFLRFSLTACALANMGFQVVILLLVVEAERRHFTGSVIGALLATSGVSGFLGAVTAPPVVRRFQPQTTVRWCIVGWIPLLGVVALSGNPLVGMFAWGLCSFMGAYINVALAVYQSRTIRAEVLGRVEGVVQFLTTGAVALGASAGGYVIDAFGSRLTSVLVALLFVVIGIAALFMIRPGRTSALIPLMTACRMAPAALWSLAPKPALRRILAGLCQMTRFPVASSRHSVSVGSRVPTDGGAGGRRPEHAGRGGGAAR